MGAVGQERRRRRIGAWLIVAAILWSVVLIVLALALPVYSGGGSLVGVNGTTVLAAVSVALLLTGLAGIAIRVGGPNHSRNTNFAVRSLGWVLLAFSLLTGFTIGLAVLPAAVLTLVAAHLMPGSPASSAPTSPATP